MDEEEEDVELWDPVRPFEDGEECIVIVFEDSAVGVNGDDSLDITTPPGASTTHFPSVCVSATLSTLRPHCSRILLNLFSSIQPCGTSNARVERVVIVVKDGSCEADENGAEDGVGEMSLLNVGPEIISSVAPTLQ